MSSFLNNKVLGNQILIPNQSLLYLTGATWAIDGNGRAYNTPTLGSELLTNGGFDSDMAGWTIHPNGTAAVAGGQSGNATQMTNVSNQAHLYQATATNAGEWYHQRFYQKNGSTFGVYRVGTSPLSSDVSGGGNIDNTDWAESHATWRALGGATYVRFSVGNGVVSSTTLWDEISVKRLTASSMIAYTQGAANQTPLTKINAITTGTQSGVIGWLDDPADPQNFIIAIRNGSGRVNLTKCVAGAYTNLISISSTFVVDAAIEIRRPSGNTFQLWYNGSQVGTDQTINDTAIANNVLPYYGVFSTYSGNTFSEFRLDGNLVPFGF